MTTNGANTRSRPHTPPGVLRFSCAGGKAARDPVGGECYYRIELADGREALVLAMKVTVEDGSLIARTDDYNTLILAPRHLGQCLHVRGAAAV